MTFRARGVYISHVGLPSGLETRADLEDYISDVRRELQAVSQAWRQYTARETVLPEDESRLNGVMSRLENLREMAVEKLQSLPPASDGEVT